jgi:2-methylcitrate dehydratase PrpD
MTMLRHYAEWACRLNYENLPVVAASNARKAIIDTIAAMLAGVNEPASRKIMAYVAREKAAGNASVTGSNCRFSTASAALINGTMAHALDYDDLLTSTRSHPSAVLVPAVLAVGETLDASGAEILVAYLAGLELIDKIGSLAAFPQYAKGWHTTSTLGGLGAAAAASKLLKLPSAQMRMAVSIAASMAGGLQKNFGTMTKPLHAGLAAQSGVMAAMLAADGFTASDDVFAGKDNYLEVTAQTVEPSSVPSFGAPFAVVSPGLHVKRYPCCFATHRALDAIFFLRSEHPQLDVKQIKSVTCMAPARSFTALIYDLPGTGLEGKFSMQYVVAAALVDGCVNIGSFTDEKVGRKNLRLLMEKVGKVEDPNLAITDPDGTDRRFTEVTVEIVNGQVFQKRIVRPKGSVDVPLTEEEIAEKFLECSRGILSGTQPDTALNILRGLESVNSISELMGSLRATS